MSNILVRFDALPITRMHVLVAVVCTVGLAADLMEMAVGSALSTVFSAAPYNMNPHELGQLLSAVYVGAIIGTPLVGWAADRWGFKRVLVPALIWLGITSSLAATRANITWLLSLRFLAGLSLGALPPLIISFLTGIAPPRYRGIYIFWVSALSFLAAPATIFLIRWLTPLHPLGIAGWRWPFAVAGVLALAMGVAFNRLPESPRWLINKGRTSDAEAEYRRFARSGRFTDTDTGAGAGTPYEGVPFGPPLHPDAGVPHASTDGVRSPPGNLRRRFAVIASLYFLHPWMNVGFAIITGPVLLQRGYDLSKTLLYVGASTFGPTLSTLVAGLFVDRIERRLSLILCTLLMAVAAVVFFTVPAASWTLAAIVAFGIAGGFYLPLLTTYGSEIFPTTVRAAATTTAWAINRVGAALVPLLLLPLFSKWGASAAARAIYLPLGLTLALFVACGSRGAAGRAVD